MKHSLEKYLLQESVKGVMPILVEYGIVLKIKSPRITRHGDYRKLPNGTFQITINANLNRYAFLLTLIHELAHHATYMRFGSKIKPHGIEWKQTFAQMIKPFLLPPHFDESLIPLLNRHFVNPKASSDTDSKLSLAMKSFNSPNDKSYIFEIPEGSRFALYNGRYLLKANNEPNGLSVKKQNQGRTYLFNPNAEVEIIDI